MTTIRIDSKSNPSLKRYKKISQYLFFIVETRGSSTQIMVLGSMDGEVVIALASLQKESAGSIPTGEFVVRSRLAPRVFLRSLWFSSLHKNQQLQISIRPGRRSRMTTS